MFKVSAHKNTTHPAGQYVYKTQAEVVTPDKTLDDYIKRKEKAYKDKLTFDQWWRSHYKEWLNYEDYSNLPDDLAKAVWKAAQENM